MSEREAAEYCNRTFSQPYPNDGRLYCDVTFDGVLCWNFTLAGSRAIGGCPGHHPSSHIFTGSGYSFKDCNKNGTWFTFPGTNRPWTNYTLCAEKETIDRSRHVLYVYIAGYAVSLIFLLLSLVIFRCLHNQLKCTRVQLHTNLFVSYVLTGALWIIYFSKAILDTSVLTENPIWCKILHVTTQYATLCNHCWMFAEGFFLHSSIVFTFASPKRLYVISIFIGWVFPIFPASAYAIARSLSLDAKDHIHCWAGQPTIMWILMAPIAATLLVNCVFLVNIMRIFVSKIRTNSQGSNEMEKLRQTARACLILIPLLGIQFIIFPFRSTVHPFGYDVFVAVIVSVQGAFVSIVFCFCNGEVITNLRKKSRDFRREHSSRKFSMSSIGTSLRRLSQSSVNRRVSIADRRLSNSRSLAEKGKCDTPLNNNKLDLCKQDVNSPREEVCTVEQNPTSGCVKYSLVPIQEV